MDHSDDEVTEDTIVNMYGGSVSPTKEVVHQPPKMPAAPIRAGSDSSVNYAPNVERYV